MKIWNCCKKRNVVFIFCLVAGVTQVAVGAAPSSETVLPDTTRAFVSAGNFATLRRQWLATQLGKLLQHDRMKPFVKNLSNQVPNRLRHVLFDLTLDDLEKVSGGEVCLALTQPTPRDFALVLLVDVTGKQNPLRNTLNKIRCNMKELGATRAKGTNGNTAITTYTLPRKNGTSNPLQIRYFVQDDLLVVTNHQKVLLGILNRLRRDDAVISLSRLRSFIVTMDESRLPSGLHSHLRWFVDPFGYAKVIRAASGYSEKTKIDLIQLLSNQGFAAVRGMGGHMSFSTPTHEVFHHNFVYAPRVPIEKNEQREHKYRLAARVLSFPNRGFIGCDEWVPSELATWLTFNWKLKEGFEYIDSLVDEYVGKPGAFLDFLDSLRVDPNGPRLDIRKELIGHLNDRVVVISDTKTSEKERTLFAVKAISVPAVEAAIYKLFEHDPSVKKRIIGKKEIVVWELIPFKDNEKNAKIGKPLVTAVAVARGHLMLSSDVHFLIDLLKNAESQKPRRLKDLQDFKRVTNALEGIRSNETSFRYFAQTDRAFWITYQSIRQGNPRVATSILREFLPNPLLSPHTVLRAGVQQTNRRELPTFKFVQPYLGPAGMYVTSYEDGWSIVGCLLKSRHPAAKTVVKARGQSRDSCDVQARRYRSRIGTSIRRVLSRRCLPRRTGH